MAQGEAVNKLSKGQEPIILNFALPLPDAEHSLDSVSSLSDDYLTVQFTNRKGIVRKNRLAIGVDERAGGTYSINPQRASDKAMETPDVTGHVLSVLHATPSGRGPEHY